MDPLSCPKCGEQVDETSEPRWGWYYCPAGHRAGPAYGARARRA